MMSASDGCNGICVALFTDAPYTGGAERYLHLLARGIEPYGFKPILVTAGSGRLDRLKGWMHRDGFEVFEAPFDPVRKPWDLYSTVQFFRKLGPKILHVNLPGPFDATYGLVAPLAKLAGIGHIVTTEHLPMVPSFAKARLLRGFSGRFIDRIITVSRDNIDHLVRNHRVSAARIRVVYNGIPDYGGGEVVDVRGELALPDETFLVAVVGSLEKRKGQGTLFGAMRRLPARIHLLVVGEGPDEADYRETVLQSGLGDRVHFLGHRNDVPGILGCVDLLAVPSTLEATPYVILEAMAAELPVVASGIYGIPELVKADETGLLFEPENEGMLAEAIGRVVEQDGLSARFGRAARERYESLFTLERSAGETVEVYRELLC
jgi:glycosyltransferase involved in cell wall biosynthesis